MADTSQAPQSSPLPGLVSWLVRSEGRKLASMAAASLVTWGAIQGTQVAEFEDIAVALLVYGAGLVWSLLEKKQQIAATSSTPTTNGN